MHWELDIKREEKHGKKKNIRMRGVRGASYRQCSIYGPLSGRTVLWATSSLNLVELWLGNARAPDRFGGLID